MKRQTFASRYCPTPPFAAIQPDLAPAPTKARTLPITTGLAPSFCCLLPSKSPNRTLIFNHLRRFGLGALATSLPRVTLLLPTPGASELLHSVSARMRSWAHQIHEIGEFAAIVRDLAGRLTDEHRSACKWFMFRALRAFRGLSCRVDAAG